MKSSAPAILKIRLPSGSRRTCGEAFGGGEHRQHAAADVGAEHQADARPAAGITPAAASVAISSTIARLEYDSTVRTAPMRMSSSTSLGSATKSARTAGDSVSGRVAATISCSASVIRPRPISDPADRAGAAVLARDEEDHADEDQERREPRQVEREHHRHQRGADVGAEHHRERRARRRPGSCRRTSATIRQVAVLDWTMLGHAEAGERAPRKRLAKLRRRGRGAGSRRTRAACRCARCACPRRAARSRRAG